MKKLSKAKSAYYEMLKNEKYLDRLDSPRSGRISTNVYALLVIVVILISSYLFVHLLLKATAQIARDEYNTMRSEEINRGVR